MNTQIRLPNHNATTNTILHTVSLDKGRIAVRRRSDFGRQPLKAAEAMARAGGGLFRSALGLCHASFKIKAATALLTLERPGQKLASGGLAMYPEATLWRVALAVYAEVHRKSARRVTTSDDLKPNAYPWLVTFFLPEFVATATEQEKVQVDDTLSLLAFGVLDYRRDANQRN